MVAPQLGEVGTLPSKEELVQQVADGGGGFVGDAVGERM